MSSEELREKIGRVFVDLTVKLFGGDKTENGDNDIKNGNPDVLNYSREQAYESKGGISSDYSKLQPIQIAHYRNFLKTQFPFENPEVYYFFWQYNKRGISRFSGNNLEREVVRTTRRLLVVSFDIIEAGTAVWEKTGEHSWGEIYMFRSSERTNLTKHPGEELKRMGLDPGDYEVTRETIEEKQYQYKWWHVPEFKITYILKKGMRGLERKNPRQKNNQTY